MVELIDERQSNDAYNEEKISSWKNNRINLIFRSSLGQFSFSQSNFSLRQAMKHFRAASGNAISVNSTRIPFFFLRNFAEKHGTVPFWQVMLPLISRSFLDRPVRVYRVESLHLTVTVYIFNLLLDYVHSRKLIFL